MIQRNLATLSAFLTLVAVAVVLPGCGGGGGGTSPADSGGGAISGDVDRLDYSGRMTVVTPAGEASVSQTGAFGVGASTSTSCLGLVTNAKAVHGER